MATTGLPKINRDPAFVLQLIMRDEIGAALSELLDATGLPSANTGGMVLCRLFGAMTGWGAVFFLVVLTSCLSSNVTDASVDIGQIGGILLLPRSRSDAQSDANEACVELNITS